MPLVLGFAEYRGGDGTGEMTRSATNGVVEGDAHSVFACPGPPIRKSMP